MTISNKQIIKECCLAGNVKHLSRISAMLVLGQRNMFEFQIFVFVVVVGMSPPIEADRFDETAELSPFEGTQFMKTNV